MSETSVNVRDLDTVTPEESQAWVKLLLAKFWEGDIQYTEDPDRSIVGETEHGTIMAARPGTSDWWEPFDLMKPEHVAAAYESHRRDAIACLELEEAPDAD